MESYTKVTQGDIDAFKASLGKQGSYRSGGKGSYSKPLPERLKVLWDALKLEGEPNFMEVYAVIAELEPEKLKVFVELLKVC